MARKYRLTLPRRLFNKFAMAALNVGVEYGTTYLLTVKGRRSGRMHTLPVTLVEEGGQRWLVAPYGEVNWVRNARAAGQVTLTRGHRSETVAIVELPPEESAPVLKAYLRRISVVRPFFDVRPDSPLEDFVAEAPRHPVFHIVKMN
jgi:deazaflavin-dependent oxidoreductase (nitroreductase family)